MLPRKLIDHEAWDPAWEETIIFFVGLLGDPVPALELLAAEQRDDYFRHKLALAARCLGEVPPQWLASDSNAQVRDGLTKSIFSIVWDYEVGGGSEVVAHLRQNLPSLLIDELLACLVGHDEEVRGRTRKSIALDLISTLGEPAAGHPGVIPALLGLLQENEDRTFRAPLRQFVRNRALHALSTLGERAARHPDVVPALLPLVEQPAQDWSARSAEKAALKMLGEGIDQHPDMIQAVLGQLDDQDQSVRAAAAETLGALGEAAARHPGVIPALLDRLENDDPEVRSAAAHALCDLGEAAAWHSEVVSALIRRLEDEDHLVRRAAAGTLGTLGELAAGHTAAVFTCVGWFDDGDALTREAAAKALRALGGTAATHPRGIPALLELLKDYEQDRATAPNYLFPAGYTPAIAPEDGHGPEPRRRREVYGDFHVIAARALGALGETAAQHPDVLPTLLAWLEHHDWWVRAAAARALESIGQVAAQHPRVIPALAERLADSDEFVRKDAAIALGALGPAAARHPNVIPTLLQWLKCAASWHFEPSLGHDQELDRPQWLERADPSWHVVAMDVLSALGEAAALNPAVIPALLDHLSGEDHWGWGQCPASAAGSLGHMGDTAARHPEVIPALIERIEDTQERARRAAAQAVGNLGEDAARNPEVIPALLGWLASHADPYDRQTGARMIQSLQNAGRVRLVRAMQDEYRQRARPGVGKARRRFWPFTRSRRTALPPFLWQVRTIAELSALG